MERNIKPQLSVDSAANIVSQQFGIQGALTPLPGEWDANFHIQSAQGEYVLKIMHAEQETAVLDLQIQTLAHLAQAAPNLAMPRVLPTKGGNLVARVEINGRSHLVWLLSYMPGTLYAHAKPQTAELRHSLGQFLGQVDAAMADFTHPAAQRALKWDLAKAGWIRDYLPAVEDAGQRALVTHFLAEFETAVSPKLTTLRHSIIHNDANDYNVLVSAPLPQPRRVVSLIDFGDTLYAPTVCNLAIAIAYAILGQNDVLTAARDVVSGYHSAYPLTEQEVELLFNLVCTRLCVSVTNSAVRKSEQPDDAYIVISEQPAWDALNQLRDVHPRLAHYTFRAACGWEPVQHKTAVLHHIQSANPALLLDADLHTAPVHVFDLSVSSLWLGANPAAMETEPLSQAINDKLEETGSGVGIGRYNEPRLLYSSPLFGDGFPTAERRTIHLGLDLWCAGGTAVYTPLNGTIHTVANNTAPLDYGPLLIVEHRTSDGTPFFTLYGHLAESTLSRWQVGDTVQKGEKLAKIGTPLTNGNWPPHLHFQLILDLLDLDEDFPGVAFASQRTVWTSLSPDPNVFCQIPAERFPEVLPEKAETLATRQARLGQSLSLSYRKPLKIVRGWMQYLYDENGRCYLDCYNNVPHVGHSNPRVITAVQQQVGLLNTNTRYLHDNITRYAERLTNLLPDPLSVCFFVNSGSEANELALRLARTHTGQEDIIVLEAAYHGHTNTLIDISPYKFAGPGGSGAKPWVHQVPIPDDYRGEFKRDDPDAGKKYADQVQAKIDEIEGFAAFICESLPSVGGQIVLPSGYLPEVYRAVRQAGGVCIADEVQVGFGRLGTHFWGFASQNAVPDIVVMGKPIGNGFPLAAVVTTLEIAASFNNGMEFFCTFGGNPVSCAAGTAVLDEIEAYNLQAHAHEVGTHLLKGLQQFIGKYPIVGDARGQGLFLGLELVRNHDNLMPAADETAYVVNRLRECGILAGTDGPYHNVVKIRPPMPFSMENSDQLLTTLNQILQEDALKL